MKLLFAMGHDGFLRNFERAIRGLAERDHRVQLALVGRRPKLLAIEMSPEAIAAEYPNLDVDDLPKSRDAGFASVADALYASRDYLHFLDPVYGDAEKLRARGRDHAPGALRRLEGSPLLTTAAGRGALDAVLRASIRALPTSPAVDAYLARAPARRCCSPRWLASGRARTRCFAAPRPRGIRTALMVHSWDNLTNKGLIHEAPDLVIVWNEAQAREAIELHGVPRTAWW